MAITTNTGSIQQCACVHTPARDSEVTTWGSIEVLPHLPFPPSYTQPAFSQQPVYPSVLEIVGGDSDREASST